MGIINIVKNVKKIHPDYVAIIKVGKFYCVYGKDAFIVSYLFDYKITMQEDVYKCGFLSNSLNKVIAGLEKHKINHIILDRRNNYDVDNKTDFKNLNGYEKIYEKAKKQVSLKLRIIRISDFLNENIKNEDIKNIIKEIEEIIDERGKVQSN